MTSRDYLALVASKNGQLTSLKKVHRRSKSQCVLYNILDIVGYVYLFTAILLSLRENMIILQKKL